MLCGLWCLSRNNILPLESGQDMARYAGYEMDISDSKDPYFTAAVASSSFDLLEFRQFAHCCSSFLVRVHSFNSCWFLGLHCPTLAGSKVFVGKF